MFEIRHATLERDTGSPLFLSDPSFADKTITYIMTRELNIWMKLDQVSDSASPYLKQLGDLSLTVKRQFKLAAQICASRLETPLLRNMYPALVDALPLPYAQRESRRSAEYATYFQPRIDPNPLQPGIQQSAAAYARPASTSALKFSTICLKPPGCKTKPSESAYSLLKARGQEPTIRAFTGSFLYLTRSKVLEMDERQS